MRTLVEIWLSGLRTRRPGPHVRRHQRTRSPPARHAATRRAAHQHPRPRSRRPPGRRALGTLTETASAVFVATTTIAFARRQHLLRRASTYLSK